MTAIPNVEAPRELTRKGRETRARIIACALEEFEEKGFAGARTASIAIRAGMSNGAFYRYFDDKRGVFLAAVEVLSAELFRIASEKWQPEDPGFSVYVTTKHYLRFYRDNSGALAAFVEASQNDEAVAALWRQWRNHFYERSSRMLRHAEDLNMLNRGVDRELATNLLGGMTEFYAWTSFGLAEAPDADIDVAAVQIALLWARSVFRGEIRTDRWHTVPAQHDESEPSRPSPDQGAA